MKADQEGMELLPVNTSEPRLFFFFTLSLKKKMGLLYLSQFFILEQLYTSRRICKDGTENSYPPWPPLPPPLRSDMAVVPHHSA